MKTQGVVVAGRELIRQTFCIATTVVFEAPMCPPSSPLSKIPIEIKTFSKDSKEEGRRWLDEYFSGDNGAFEKNGECHLAFHQEKPVGMGWRFPAGPVNKRLGYEEASMYLGGFWVLEPFRKKNIAPTIACSILKSLPPGTKAITEIDRYPLNMASKRCFEKIGFRALFTMKQYVFAGVMVYHRCSLAP